MLAYVGYIQYTDISIQEAMIIPIECVYTPYYIYMFNYASIYIVLLLLYIYMYYIMYVCTYIFIYYNL